jgi:hypothetical protein
LVAEAQPISLFMHAKGIDVRPPDLARNLTPNNASGLGLSPFIRVHLR